MTKLLRVLAATLAALALSARASDFPEGVRTPAADEIILRLTGQTITAELPDKSSWRIEYKPDRTYTLETSKGFSDTGTWRAEPGKLCTTGRRMKGGCNEVRTKGDDVYVKHDNGDVLQYVNVR